MMANAATFIMALLLVSSTMAQLSYKGGNCPLKNTVTKCTPSCVSDHQCGYNMKCCPNKCGHQSCATPSPVNTGYGEGGYKGSGDSAVYCDGVKCPPYQKCEFDRKTKRNSCVRT